MKFAVNTIVSDEGVGPAALGRALEERGFATLFLAEHSHIPVRRETPWGGGPMLPRSYFRSVDPFVALTAAAGATKTLRLATGIALLPERDVIHTAKSVASLDLVSGGRAVFGVGAGWNREEMRNHGVDPATRGELLDEQLAALKTIWTREEAEFHGRFIDFDPIYLWPKPVQSPHPPVYVGGESVAARNRLLAHGDGWFPRVATDPATLREVSAWLAEHGRPGVPITIGGVGADPDVVARFVDAGVSEVSFALETAPEADTLRALDRLSTVADRFR
ncbi:LLM class F420-dependent oxidoreductase [Pseudonocardia acaciae]|uniref:LLM class F420-dependent oxidoreductase n=1 Tax=Pseudonocardia acaciae TaxID=551276 RepID=UPI0004918CEA|nr:LLM class F420-dependent oxidoreductase [Pseudonocardia acaciae]